MSEICKYVDICIANEEDAYDVFGIEASGSNVQKGMLNREGYILITVNGIGPKGALGILSVISADDIRFAVLADDAKAIAKAPGIGNKTAGKLILELKDKFKLETAFEQRLQNQSQNNTTSTVFGKKEEAVQALTVLGYSASDALKLVNQIEITEEMSSEEILKLCLKKLY
jgi:Holliday junction DNA helicase RuvA